jgi:hypothetical protein
MHSIKDRAVVVDGQIVVRPIMIIALTYDHRILDGREAVTFLGELFGGRSAIVLLTTCSETQAVSGGSSSHAPRLSGDNLDLAPAVILPSPIIYYHSPSDRTKKAADGGEGHCASPLLVTYLHVTSLL